MVGLKEAGKPVVVSMGDLAASGGYWISMDADRIYADPSTITGSIGIYGLFPTIPHTLEKIGVRTDGVGTTRLAGAFDITRPLNPAVGQLVQSVIDKGYRDFTGRVAQARHKTVADVDAWPQRISAVTREEVLAAARHVWRDDGSVTALLTPAVRGG